MGRSFLISVIAGLTLCVASVSAQNTGPRLQWTPHVLDFDTVSCGRSASATVELENIGDTALTVSECDLPSTPFSGSIAVPFTLQPAEKRSFTLHYSPTRAPLGDSLYLRLLADSPVPTAMGFLFDISDGMADAFSGSTRIEAAHDACTTFLDRVMAAGAPAHQGSVYAYSTSSNYRLLRGLSEDRQKLKGALPSAAAGAHACTWDAMQRSITNMQTSTLRKFLIVFSGSTDAGVANCGPYSAAGVVNAATAANIAVYTISFSGEDEAKLRNIADASGGHYFQVTTPGDLDSAMDVILQDLQYDVPQYLVLRGKAVSPVLEFSANHVLFPATMVGDTTETALTLRNAGTAPLQLYDVGGLANDMTLLLPDTEILPADSFVVTARFHPQSQHYSHAVCTFSYNSCGGGAETFHLYGMGYERENPSIGPVLALSTEELAFGIVTCSEEATLPLTVKNVGDAPLSLALASIENPRFTRSDPTLSLEAGISDIVTVRYQPGGYLGEEEAVMQLDAEMRTSTSTALLCHLGRSALDPLEETLRRDEAWKLAYAEIASGLTSTNSISDSIAVIVADSSIRVALPVTGSRRDAASVVLRGTGADSTDILDALASGLELLLPSPQQKRLILLTSDGDVKAAARSTTFFGSCLATALQQGITVSCILLGAEAADSLQAVCEQSGGLFRRAGTMTDIRDAITHIERLVLAPKTVRIPLTAQSVSGDLLCSTDTLHFPDTWMDKSSCLTLTLLNRGDGDLTIHDALQGMFTVRTPLPLTIPAQGSTDVEICFEPERPNNFTGSVIFRTNSCLQENTSLYCTGAAHDSLGLRLGGTFSVRPGGLVHVPVYASRTLTEPYDLRHLTFGIAYNPTLLYPDFDLPLVEADGSPLPGEVPRPRHEFDTERGLATTLYTISRSTSDPAIATSGGDNLLCYLRLRAYLGNELTATVNLDSGTTYPQNISFPVWGEAVVQLDSLPWLEQRLIDPSALYGVTLGKHAPNPVRGSAQLQFHCAKPAQVRLTLHDAMGRVVRVLTDASYSPGVHSLLLDTHDLPPGIYYYCVLSGGGMQSRLMLITR